MNMLKVALLSASILAVTGCSAVNSGNTVAVGGGENSFATIVKQSPVKSINALAFGPNNVLFVGDSLGGAVHAVEGLTTDANSAGKPYNLKGIDSMLAKALGALPSEVYVRDLAVHPDSREAFLAVSRGTGLDERSVLVRINPQGEINVIDLNNYKRSTAKIDSPVQSDLKFWRDVEAVNMSITDMRYANGEVYVSGLTNDVWSSTLHKMAYPFTGDSASSRIEMYHTVHNQNETRAPIRTFLPIDINGEEKILAAYTCTPLVTLPVDELQDRAKVKSRTIAELGYGNTPIDIARISMKDANGNANDMIVVTNELRTALMFPVASLGEADQGDDITLKRFDEQVGLPIWHSPLSSVMYIADQDDNSILGVRRHITTGELELLSFPKGYFIRISDHINEFDFPSYEYTETGKAWKPAHAHMRTYEGYPELAPKL